ncbi:hypothetical protein ABFX02_08G162600 [Erythranthe guttata]
MDNQDQHYGGGDARSDDVVIISDETTAAEEENVDLALTLVTGARTVGSPEPAGSEDSRTLNLIESLTEAPAAAAAESSGGARNNAGMIWGGERNSEGMLDFMNKGVVAVGNPGSAFRPFTPVRAQAAAAVVNQSPPVQERSPPINVPQASNQPNRANDGGGESSDQRRGGGDNAGMIWGGERNSEGMLDFMNKGVVAVGNPGSAFRPFTRVRAAAAAESSGGARTNAGIIRGGGERNSAGELGFVNKGKSPMIITTGKAESVGQSSSRHNQNLAGSSDGGGRYYSQTSGGGRYYSQTSGSGGGGGGSGGGGDRYYSQTSGSGGSGSGGRYYSQTSGGGAGGSGGHNPSIGSAVTIAALPPLPPRPRDGYSQTSGGGGAGGSGHNPSIASAAVTIAALPPLPPRPRPQPIVEYVCIFCKRARFSSMDLVEEHMSICPRRVIDLG